MAFNEFLDFTGDTLKPISFIVSDSLELAGSYFIINQSHVSIIARFVSGNHLRIIVYISSTKPKTRNVTTVFFVILKMLPLPLAVRFVTN